MEKITRAFVVANEQKPIARRIKKEAEGFLRSQGVKISASSPKLIVTVGGDGTVLFSKRFYGTPFFSIGSSTSFICQSNFSDWKRKLSSFLKRPKVERRLLLQSSIGKKKLPLSLNEIGIRNPEPRVLSLHLAADSRNYAFRADGILFSTPTGSPAYCYSCGGKQMAKNDTRFQAVAIAPFRRLFPPRIFTASAVCLLRISGKERPQLFIDGQITGMMSQKETLVVKASRLRFCFAAI